MASPISDKTLEPKIKETALNELLQNGFENTSIKVICNKINVTTGAFYKRFKDKEELFKKLVEPVASVFLDKLKYNDFDIADMNTNFDESMKLAINMINYVCDNMNIFKLLIACSHGSKYQNYLDEIINISEMQTMKMLKDNNINKLSQIDVHMLATAQYNALFEVVRHDLNKEESFDKIKKIYNFFSLGWKDIFEIK